MDNLKVTDEQKKELEKLRKVILKRSFIVGVKSALMLLFMNITAVVVNAMTFNSKDFQFFMSLLAVVLVVSDLMKWQKEERIRIEESVKKILDIR